MSTLTHIMGHWIVGAHPSKLEMREDDGVIYFQHGGDTVSLTLTEEQADQLSTILGTIRARDGFREMEEE